MKKIVYSPVSRLKRQIDKIRSRSFRLCLILLVFVVAILILPKFPVLSTHVFAAQTNDQARNQSGSNLLAEAVQLNKKVVELYKMGRVKDALPLAKRSLAIREQELGPTHPDIAACLNNLGLLFQAMGDFSVAKPYFERALAINKQEMGPTHLVTADSLNNLGRLLQAMGDLAVAKLYFERALAIREKELGPTHPNTATSLHNLGLLLKVMGDFAGAQSYYERALSINEQVFGPAHPATATNLNSLGLLLRAMGDLSGAKPYTKRALTICEQVLGPTHPNTVASLNNMGILLHDLGDLSGAKPYLERALLINEQKLGPTHPATANSLNNLGALLKDLGDFAEAMPYYERALAIREQVLGPAHPETAMSLNNLGRLHQAMGDLTGAKPYFERALTIHEQVLGPTHPNTARSLNNFGILLHDLGDLASAQLCYERALAINEQVFGPIHPNTARYLDNLGSLLYDLGDFSGAKLYQERALAINEQVLGPAHPNTAISMNNLGGLLQAMGNINAATALMSRALEAEEQSLTATLAIGTEAQKRNFLKMMVGSSYGVVSLLVHSAPRDAHALRMATTTVLRRKGRALDATVEGLRLIQADLTPMSRALVEKLTALRAWWAYLQLHPPEKMVPEERRKTIADLEKQLRTIEGRLSAQSAAFQKRLTPVTLEEVQAEIPNSTALVEFYVYERFDAKAKVGKRWGKPNYFAYVLRRSGEPRWVALGSAQTIDAAAEALRNAVAYRRKDVLERARELDVLTMAKVRPLLGDAENLLISPDGALNLIPFAALVDENGKYLIENCRLSYLSSGRDLLRRRAEDGETREKPLIVGNATFDGALGVADSRGKAQRSVDMTQLRFGRLPGTAEEVHAIGQLLKLPKERILTKEQATEAAVKAIRGPNILHLATHGFFLPDLPDEPLEDGFGLSRRLLLKPSHRIEDSLLRSGLALSGANRRNEAKGANDGVLTAIEVAGLDLWGTEIVALSACETGVGDVRTGEGVFGLRRALVLAGAQSQLMTLWQVSDETTKELMVSWYGQLLQGKGRAEALRQAQLAALQGKDLPVTKRPLRMRGVVPLDVKKAPDPGIAGTRHPYYWASFILSGASEPIRIGQAEES